MQYNPQPYHTADGTELEVGLKVFAVDPDTRHTKNVQVMSHIVKTIHEGGRKVSFTDGTGWRVDGIFASADNAIEANEARFVHLRLNPMDAGEILMALAKQLKALRQEVAIIEIAQDRELMQWERAMLPPGLMHASLEDIRENRMHFICAADGIESLIKEIHTEYERANQLI